ncbi:MAG: D-alanyl-D-alanine carboxypeptidase/D-alanyl-D-alanine-endopeptidase [Candidatus Eremiobacterota bacterium]
MRKVFFILFILLYLSLNPSFAGGKEYIQSNIDYILSDSYFYGGNVSVYIKSLKTGDVIYDYNKNLSLAPASNMKIFTTATALYKLTDTFRFDTNIYGNAGNGKVEGDLIIYSNGDPTHCVYFNKPPVKIFEDMAQKLYLQGIRRIEGDLIADDSFFDRNLRGKGWKDEYKFESYSAEISPLSLNENVVDVRISPGKASGLPAIVTLFPPAGIFSIINHTVTSHNDETISVYPGENNNKITVSGSIPASYSTMETYVNVHQPALYTASAFAKILKNKGIKIKGHVRLIDLKKESYKRNELVMLCSHKSPPLPQAIAYINKESDNLSAEMLLKTIGGIYNGYGTSENGSSIVKGFLGYIGTDVKGLTMVDGSGLSPENRVTARIIVDVLTFMYRSEYRKSFMDSLSVAGVDGTLKKRLTGTIAKGNLKAKTGTLNGVSSLSGYVTTSYGQTLVFSIVSNNVSEGAAKDGEDRIVNVLASCKNPI